MIVCLSFLHWKTNQSGFLFRNCVIRFVLNQKSWPLRQPRLEFLWTSRLFAGWVPKLEVWIWREPPDLVTFLGWAGVMNKGLALLYMGDRFQRVRNLETDRGLVGRFAPHDPNGDQSWVMIVQAFKCPNRNGPAQGHASLTWLDYTKKNAWRWNFS